MNIESFHAWLRAACPAPASTLMAELQIGRKANAADYEGLPVNALELTEALLALAIKGLVEKRDAMWFWKAEVVKQDQQQELFA